MQGSSGIKAPEWFVYLRTVLLGVVLAEVMRIGFLSSRIWGQQLYARDQMGMVIAVSTFTVAGLIAYGHQRDAHRYIARVISSRRADLGALVLAGAWIDYLLTPQLAKFHDVVSALDNGWVQAVLVVALVIMLTPVLRPMWSKKASDTTQLYFLSDEEISEHGQDALNVSAQASAFADTVLTSDACSGMVFGLDAPWGTGKTSFLNMAAKRWSEAALGRVIVFQFEPLRYASEPDLSERFIRDLCAKISQSVFAPEFLPAATRYSRMLKGKTDVSFLGIKFALEPSNETIDELLGDIDGLLERIGHRLVIIIDDLDRLEPKLVNNVLFMVRRTFKLRQATYVLCYDTEQLLAGREEGTRAREFLEKFVTAKLNLFVDLQSIKAFLETDWYADSARFQTIAPDAMLRLRRITSAVSALISGTQAHNYVPLLGDLRKVKRFINAVLLMNLEKSDFAQGDFYDADLMHLALLYLGYPSLFRKIYAEETEGRVGSFSVQSINMSGTHALQNAQGFDEIVKNAEPAAQFLLKQLFDVETLKIPSHFMSDEGLLRTRACFNRGSRNLENYLQLIVRFKMPEAITTFKMYKDLLDEVATGRAKVSEVLERVAFGLSEEVHDQFWRILVNNAHALSRMAAEDAIATLVRWLPRYSMIYQGNQSLRHRAIYSLVLLLDRAGFGEPIGDRIRSSADVIEIAERILGAKDSSPLTSLIRQFLVPPRGALGWEDLMLFRLTCCADRLGQFHNIYSALMRYESPTAHATGDVDQIALKSMRRFTQQVFQCFRERYIDTNVSFFEEVDRIPDEAIAGDFSSPKFVDANINNAFEAVRSTIKSFVIYQLVNQKKTDGSGIGCGVYDEVGAGDAGGIHRAMSSYLFGFCFNPEYGLSRARAFGDYCIRAIQDGMIRNMDQLNDVGSAQAVLTGLLGREETRRFWASSGERIKNMLINDGGKVIAYHYSATYAERLPLAFRSLDQLVSAD